MIFIIKKENLDLFRNTIGKRVENQIATEYIFQDNQNIPKKYILPTNRTKPLGTGHALLCAKDAIKSDFAVINADDFYGYDAFKMVSNFLKQNNILNKYVLIGYEIQNTLCSNNIFNRGICHHKNGNLETIVECKVKKQDDSIFASPLNPPDFKEQKLSTTTLVSMNMFGFTHTFLNFINESFIKFLEINKNNLSTCEFFLPSIVSSLIKENKISVELIKTTSKWFGLTYEEDKLHITNAILNMINDGLYPKKLWQNNI